MFRQHGEFNLFYADSALLMNAKGAWNKESSIACSDAIFNIVTSKLDNKFAFVANTLEVEGLTPGSQAVWHNVLNSLELSGLNAMFRVDDIQSTKYQIYHQIFDQKLSKKILYDHSLNIQQAFFWLQTYGFLLSGDPVNEQQIKWGASNNEAI